MLRCLLIAELNQRVDERVSMSPKNIADISCFDLLVLSQFGTFLASLDDKWAPEPKIVSEKWTRKTLHKYPMRSIVRCLLNKMFQRFEGFQSG